jgi:hypothetical protein
MTRYPAGWALSAVAIVLMLVGIMMIFTGSSSALAVGIITVGIALVAVAEADKRRRGHRHPWSSGSPTAPVEPNNGAEESNPRPLPDGTTAGR